MKKSAVVFLITLCIVIAGLLTVSCNSAVKEEFGTVVLDFGGGGTRAVGADGLPLLNDSRILIKGAGSLSGPFSKEFSSAQGVSLSFPIGDEVTLRVSILTPSARWSSAPQSFTVEAGTNALSVKLSKKISGLNNLLFTQTKVTNSQGVPSYSLTLHMDGKPINNVPESTRLEHIFSRDSKGRLYVGYTANEPGDPQKLVRYTSEGELDGHPAQSAVDFLANDYTTGKMYGASGRHLMEIKEDLGLNPVTSGYETGLFAVDNGRIAGCPDWNDYRLYFSKVGSSSNPNVIDRDMLEGYAKRYGLEDWQAKDLFIRGDYLYILFSSVEESDSYDDDAEPTLGAVLKWKLGTGSDGLPDIVGDPILIGKPAGSLPIENQVLPSSYYAKNFYGAVKVIGFDDENLYIADDGVRFEFEKGKPRIKENKNRIATLNRNHDTIIFTDAASGISWQNESPVWTGVNTKALVWKKNSYGGFDYYQLKSADASLPTETFKPGDGNVSGDNSLTDVFCYDEGGNLYIVKYRSGTYQVCRFELQDDGSYDRTPVIASLYESDGYPLSDKPTAIAVDTSGNVSSGKNVLYYSYESTESVVKRIEWNNDNFASANFNDLWKIADQPSMDGKTQFTSLAANQDGLFVGEFLKLGSPGDHKYKIHVKKYPHDRPNYDDPQGTIIIVDEAQQIYGIEESLNALYIQDGVLYGLTTKEFRNEHNGANEPQKASISGKLWKIGKTDFSGDSTLENPLYSSEPKPWPGNDNQWKDCGKFAPYRFIAVKPKKLVIASDGFYGYMKSGQRKADQLQFIWNFDLKADGSTDGNGTSYNKGEGITFSKSLENGSYFSWN